MKRLVLVILCMAAMGCGGATASTRGTVASATGDARAAIESNEDLHTSLQTKDEEVRALRTQLGLAKAEATELRMRRSLPSTETIRIAPVPPIPEEGWQPSEAADDAALPVLRLYGQGDEGTTVEIDDPKSITEGSVDPVTRYRRGLHSLKERDFDKALKSFDTFARLHPTHVYADNALYWSVEIYYLRHDNKRALRLLKQLLDQYPSGNKVPDTLYKMGKIHLKQGSTKQAKSYFQQLRERFPGSAAAQLASREDAS